MFAENLYQYVCDIEKEYDIDETLFAKGEYFEVFRGFRYSDNLKVAIKKFYPKPFRTFDEDQSITIQKILLRELEIQASINHPFCLNLINFCLNPQPMIVTPFMPNGDLLDLMRNKYYDENLSTQKNCSIYALCMTMNFLHKIGIIHRNLKPHNIFINEDKDICIANFGFSQKTNESIAHTKIAIDGSIYMAPELLLEEYYTNSIDVYSFGVIYYQLISYTRNPKLNNGKMCNNSLFSFVHGARFAHPSNMSDAQYMLYMYCTNQNSDDRPTFEQLAEMFETDESLWLDNVDKDEFLKYVEKCKKINQKAMENRTFFNIMSKPTVNLIRSARIAKSKRSASKRPD